MGCIHCGRSHEHVYFCDFCDTVADDDHNLYEDENGKEVCFECLKEELNQVCCDDCDSERCSECGGEAETLYQMEGDLLCEDCLKAYADEYMKVEVD